MASQEPERPLCSDCFRNSGLRIEAKKLGLANSERCAHCGLTTGAKLSHHDIEEVAHRFFVRGSMVRADFGGAPQIQFNSHQRSSIDPNSFHTDDADLISATIGVGFFYYGPNLWMLGEVYPLQALQDENERGGVLRRIVTEYPEQTISDALIFYRLRKSVDEPGNAAQYDSAPSAARGTGGRLDSEDLPVLYASTDLQLCVHECRVASEDEAYVACLKADQPLRMLDLTGVLREDVTAFESLDIAVHMIFLASSHAYPITRAIARAAHEAGFDGIIFPSYFSLIRTGGAFLETVYGLPARMMQGSDAREAAKTVPNFALFGHPVAEGKVSVVCINRLYVRQASYDLGFGPVSP